MINISYKDIFIRMEKVSSNDIRNLSEIYSSIYNQQTNLNEQEKNPFAQAFGAATAHTVGTIVQPPLQYVRGMTGYPAPEQGGVGINPVSTTTYRAGAGARKDAKKTADWLQQFRIGAGGVVSPSSKFCTDDKGNTIKCSLEVYGDLINEHLELIFEKKQVEVIKSGGKLGRVEIGPDGKGKMDTFQEIKPSDPVYADALSSYNQRLTPERQTEYQKKLDKARKEAEQKAAAEREKAAAEKARTEAEKEKERAEKEKGKAEQGGKDSETPASETPASETPAEEPKTVLAKQEGQTGVVKVSGGQPVKGSFEKKDWSATEKERYETLRGAEQLKKDAETVEKIKKEREQNQKTQQKSPEEKPPEGQKTTKESYDSFDNISDFLMYSGYAQNLNEATYIMVNMDEQWKNYILELFE